MAHSGLPADPPKQCEEAVPKSSPWKYGTLPSTLRIAIQATQQLLAWQDHQSGSVLKGLT